MTLEELGATVGTVLGSATIAWFAGVKNLVMPKPSQSIPTPPTSKKDQNRCDGECFLEAEMTVLSNELAKTNKEVSTLNNEVKSIAEHLGNLSRTVNAGFAEIRKDLNTLQKNTAISEAKQEIYKANVENLTETTNLIARELSGITGQLSVLLNRESAKRQH